MLKIKLVENEDGTYTPHLDLNLSLNGVFGFPLEQLPQTRSLFSFRARSLDDSAECDEAALEFMGFIKESLIEDLEERNYPKVLTLALKAMSVEVIWALLVQIWTFILAQYGVLSGQFEFDEDETDE